MLINKISFSLLFFILTVVYTTRVENLCTFPGDIPCDDGKCITRHYWCDGDVDCNQDESDEKYCDVQSPDSCSDKHFFCDGKCMPIYVVCDGTKDCNNEEDEKNCAVGEPTHSSQNEPENFVTSTTTIEIYTSSSPTTMDYYGARNSESNNRNDDRYHAPHSATNPPFIANNHNGYHDPHSATNTPVNANNRYGYHDPHSVTHTPVIANNRHGYYGPHSVTNTPVIANNRNGYHDPHSVHYRPNYDNYDTNNNYPVNSHNRNPQSNQFETSQISHYSQTTSTRHRQDTPLSDDFNQQRNLRFWLQVDSPHSNVVDSNYTRFYFAKNYTRDFEYDYESVIGDAKAWLLNQRDDSYSWGGDTPRALIALSLVSNSFKSDDEDNELMKKSIQTHLGVKLLRNQTGIEKMSTTRLAMYINALLATCQNPRNFLGVDLVKSLYNSYDHMERRLQFINPLIHLSLCLTDSTFYPGSLRRFLLNSFPTQMSKDLHILATIAMACASQRHPSNHSVRAVLDEAAQILLREMNPVNGTFGSKYTTALALQALMSVNMSRSWDSSKTVQYLARQQNEDGSFGDMQSTYYTMIALSGRSLVHLRNTACDTPSNVKKEWTPGEVLNKGGPRVTIKYTVQADYPNFIPLSQLLTIPKETNFIDIMRVAAYQDPRMKFNYKLSNGQFDVDMIANIPNDPERGMFWNLYWLPSSARNLRNRPADLRARYINDFSHIRPNDDDEFIFYYQSDF